jgi:hypothetical protein
MSQFFVIGAAVAALAVAACEKVASHTEPARDFPSTVAEVVVTNEACTIRVIPSGSKATIMLWVQAPRSNDGSTWSSVHNFGYCKALKQGDSVPVIKKDAGYQLDWDHIEK